MSRDDRVNLSKILRIFFRRGNYKNSQGITELIALGILKNFNITDYPVDSADSIHLQIAYWLEFDLNTGLINSPTEPQLRFPIPLEFI